MNALIEAVKAVADFMAEHRWEYCIIGGLAVQQWGEPRTTLDADLTLLSEWGEEESYVTAILARFESRVPDGHDFAMSRRVLLIRAPNGRDVDISLGALPFEIEMVRRAVRRKFAPGVILRCCTAEDLFIMKAFAARPRDWVDVEGIVARQEKLDTSYIMKHLSELCELKEAPEILDQAKRMLEGKP